jgi:hypothetical protein
MSQLEVRFDPSTLALRWQPATLPLSYVLNPKSFNLRQVGIPIFPRLFNSFMLNVHSNVSSSMKAALLVWGKNLTRKWLDN